MASRLFKQFLFSLNPMLTYIEGSVVIGATGAVGTIKGGGISNIVRLSAGTYQIILEDQYNKVLGFQGSLQAPVTGSALTSTVSGTVYVINALGTATAAQWQAVGLSAYVTPAVGVAFKASASASIGGSASVKALGVCAINQIQLVGDPSLTVINQSPYMVVQCLGPTASGDTTQVATDPADGSKLFFALMLRNSNLAGKGE